MPDNLYPRDQPLDRTFSLLEAVVSAGRPVSITEVATAVGLPAPTVHRLVAQLLARDLLKRAIGSKRVLAGPRLVDFGSRVLEGAMLADRSHSVLMNLAADLKEHCQIGIVAEGEVLYIDTARSDQAVGLQFQPGRRAPLHCTSIGKLFLSSQAPKAFEAWLTSAALTRFTARTITNPDDLRREIAEVRERGWASSIAEFVDGVVGCAVPVQRLNRFIAGLGIAAPSVRLDAVRMHEVLPQLRTASYSVAEAMD